MTKKLEVHKVYFRISYLNMIGVDLLLEWIKSPTMTYIILKDWTNLNLRTKDYDRNKDFIEKFYLNH